MLERLEGVEPSSLAWEARVMPLYDSRDNCEAHILHQRSIDPVHFTAGRPAVDLKTSEHEKSAFTEPIVTFLDVRIVVLHHHGGRQNERGCSLYEG